MCSYRATVAVRGFLLGFRVDEILGPVRVEEICPRYPSTSNPKTGSFVGSLRREDPISFLETLNPKPLNPKPGSN